jgi:hypothetical protein
MCEFLSCTPKELGKRRIKDPEGIAFLEQHIIWKAEEEHKAYKEMERRSKSKRRR